MFKKVLIILFFQSLFIGGVLAESYTGKGRFYSQDDDSQAFVKQQLLYLAFRDVLSQELEKMGLSATMFWEKYEEKFDKSFEAIDQELRKKYEIDEEGKGSAKNLIKYKEISRNKKLRLKSKFGRIQTAVKQFKIEKLSRSPKIANARYIRLKASVNKQKLHDIYLKFTSSDVGRTYKNIFLSFKFNLDGMSWKDLGVESQSDFTSVVYGHWKKWFEEHTGTFIENVHLADDSKNIEIENHLKEVGLKNDMIISSVMAMTEKEQSPVASQSLTTGEDGEEILVEEDTVADLSDTLYNEFNRSLWLKLTVNVSKKYENEITKEREFEVSGDYLMIELDTNSFLSHQDFERVSKSYSYEDPQKLSSLAASFIYAMPIKSFNSLQKKMASIRSSSNKVSLNIENAESLFPIMQLKDFLADKGIRLQLKPVFKSFDGTEGVLTLNFQGKADEVNNFLKELNGQDIGKGFVMKVSMLSPLNVSIERDPSQVDSETNSVENNKKTKPTKSKRGKW